MFYFKDIINYRVQIMFKAYKEWRNLSGWACRAWRTQAAHYQVCNIHFNALRSTSYWQQIVLDSTAYCRYTKCCFMVRERPQKISGWISYQPVYKISTKQFSIRVIFRFQVACLVHKIVLSRLVYLREMLQSRSEVREHCPRQNCL